MAAPVISSTQSYLGFRKNEPFQFFPTATGNPLRWALDKNVTGLAIETHPIYAATGVHATDVVTATGHDFENGDKVYFVSISGGSGLAANTIYYVRDKATDTLKLAATLGGAAIDFGSDISAAQLQKVSTGRIYSASGIAVQGPITLLVSATNGDGTGTREFVLGIGPGSSVAAGEADTAIDLALDLTTGLVKPGRTMAATQTAEAQGVEALGFIKSGDVRIFAIRAFKDGVQVDPNFTALKMVFKELSDESVLIDADSMEKVGSGADAVFRLAVTVTRTAVAAPLSNNVTDRESAFDSLVELEWRATVTHDSVPLNLVGSSQVFTLKLSGDFAEED